MESDNLHKAAETTLKNGTLYRLNENENEFDNKSQEDLYCEDNAFDDLFKIIKEK